MDFQKMFRKQIEEKLKLLDVELPPFARYLESVMINLGSRFKNDLDYESFKWSPENEGLKAYCNLPAGWSFLLKINNPQAMWFLKHSLGNYLGIITHTRRRPGPEEKVCDVPDCETQGSEWDHILPHSWGGPNKLWNFQLLCKTHNQLKSSSLTSFARKLHTDESFQREFELWCRESMV